MELEKFLARCTYMTRQNMAEVQSPDGDIQPSIFHYHDGESVQEMPLPWEGFNDRDSKDIMIEIVAMASRFIVPRFLAFQATQWAAEMDLSKLTADERQMVFEAYTAPEHMTMPAQHPDRWEIVGITAMDGERYLGKQSKIERDGVNPPVYGPWEHHPSAGGMMVTPLQDVLREARIKSGR